MDARKPLLFVGDNKQGELQQIANDMRTRGWTVQHASDWDQAGLCLNRQPCEVGLAHLNPRHLPARTELDKLVDGTQTEWVALVDTPTLGNSNVQQLIHSMFFAYHTIPGDAAKLDCVLDHASAMARLSNRDYGQKEQAGDEYEMVGSTVIMRQLFADIRKIAAVDAPVLITGESGTGKELTARAIHERSKRAHGPFNAVNCAAIPANLVQSELFGHEKGAFTGANQRKAGHFEATAGGTIFLDEIGDLPLDLQVNLLRFLESHRIQRVGSSQEIPVDVRVLAATHVDLETAVAERRFREDLYHRLNVLTIRTPPLRERQEDIEVLANFFFHKFRCEKSSRLTGISEQALIIMHQYDWPGNVRELINRIRRAMVMCDSRLIRPADLGLERRKSSRSVVTLEQAREKVEKNTILSALMRNQKNVSHAAQELGISRVTLYRLLEKHHIPHAGKH